MEPELSVDPDEGVRIAWPDGHQSSFTFPKLRSLCPCAMCHVHGVAGPGPPGLSGPSAPGHRLLRVEPIGRYAVCFLWGDGHSSGIYSWDYLRSRCDCIACRLAREAEGS